MENLKSYLTDEQLSQVDADEMEFYEIKRNYSNAYAEYCESIIDFELENYDYDIAFGFRIWDFIDNFITGKEW